MCAQMNEMPHVHDHPHHHRFLACRCFKGEITLSSSALEVFMNNLDRYGARDLECIKYFPARIKSALARKFLASRAYMKNASFNYNRLIHLMLHDKMEEVDLTLIAVDDDVMKALEVCRSLRVLRISQPMASDRRARRTDLLDGANRAGSVLTPEGIIGAVRNFPELTALQIENSPAVNDDVLAALATSCPRLQRLNLFRSEHVTDTGIAALRNMQALTAIDLSGSQISDIGLEIILNSDYTEHLEDMRLNDCNRIENFDLTVFATRCRYLTVFACRGSISSDKMNNWNAQNLKNLKQINWAIEW